MSPIAATADAFALENELNFFDENSVQAAYERQISKLNEALAKKNSKIEELEKKNNVFKKRLTKYYKQRNYTIADYVKENDKLDDKLSKTEAERDGLKSTNKKLVKKISEIEETIKKQLHRSMKSEMESKIYFMKQESQDQIATLEKRILELESDVKGLEAEVELTGSIKDELQVELENAENEKTALQQKFYDLQSDYNNLGEKMNDVNGKIKSMEKIQLEWDTVKKSKNDDEKKLQSKIDELNFEIDNLLEKNVALKSQNDEICKFVIDKQEKIKILFVQLFPSESKN